MSKEIDQAVLDLLVKVNAKRKEIEKAKTKPSWKTSCSFGRNPDNAAERVNIQVIKDVNKLVDIYGFLLLQESYNDLAADHLRVPRSGMWQNYPIQDWKADIKARVASLSIEQKQRELDDLDNRVNQLVTPEQRRVMELKALQEILN